MMALLTLFEAALAQQPPCPPCQNRFHLLVTISWRKY